MPWGTQRPQGLPTIVGTVAGADVTLTAGTDVTGFTPASALIAPNAGSWAYVVMVDATIVNGATAPVSLVIKLKTATPTTLDTYTLPPANLVNSAITFNCGTTAATLKANSRAVFAWTLVSD